jgi:histidyl-tRNA synthetase
LAESEEGQLGLEELEFVLTNSKSGVQSSKIEFDFTLARGLNYYTGTIFEVAAEGVAMGSVGGGGRYADLTSIFGLKNTSGVGISFGLDRIYLCLEELGLFPTEVSARPAILFANFGEAEAVSAYQWVTKLVAKAFVLNYIQMLLSSRSSLILPIKKASFIWPWWARMKWTRKPFL